MPPRLPRGLGLFGYPELLQVPGKLSVSGTETGPLFHKTNSLQPSAYHLEIIDPGINSRSHFLPLLGRLGAGIEGGPEPGTYRHSLETRTLLNLSRFNDLGK